jgi:hypothetical protein
LREGQQLPQRENAASGRAHLTERLPSGHRGRWLALATARRSKAEGRNVDVVPSRLAPWPTYCDMNAKLSHPCVPTRQANHATYVCKQQPREHVPTRQAKLHFAFPFFVFGTTLSVTSNSYRARRKFAYVVAFSRYATPRPGLWNITGNIASENRSYK